MFKPTKPFKDTVNGYPGEPSLRIGRTVPKGAVNLAYYYNPTATDAEKILSAEAPRRTIDHRVEEAYRYLFDQASNDDNLFPGAVYYEDEEGYAGRLGRMWVNWYEEIHVLTKNVHEDETVIVTDKSELPKVREYSDIEGYTGNMYLDSADYEVYKTTIVNTDEDLDRAVLNHELVYHDITGKYIEPKDLDKWMIKPGLETASKKSKWPKSINVDSYKMTAIGGDDAIVNYVNSSSNPYDEAIGTLTFKDLEYEQVYMGGARAGEVSTIAVIKADFTSPEYQFQSTDEIPIAAPSGSGQSTGQQAIDTIQQQFDAFVSNKLEYIKQNLFKAKYEAHMQSSGKQNYTEIDDFINNLCITGICSNVNCDGITNIKNAINTKDKSGNRVCKHDIAIVLDDIEMKKVIGTSDTGVINDAGLSQKFVFVAHYKYQISNPTEEGTYKYSVVAVYDGILKKTVKQEKEIPAEYQATCHYTGIARKTWSDYDGQAYYRGAVTKGNVMGNINPDTGDDELLMFPDDEGYLRRPVEVTGEDGTTEIHNFYRVEGDYFYITDVFKDGVACFYKYPLKHDIYDYRGPDDNGFYEGDAVKISTNVFKNIPSTYKYSVKLTPSEYEEQTILTDANTQTTVNKVKRYSAALYTSFISSTTDTFKVIYNAFNDMNENNVELNSGVIEDIYGYPFMLKHRDYELISVEPKSRTNIIAIPNARIIDDTRHYVTFTFRITAEIKEQYAESGAKISEARVYTTRDFTRSILNKDYAATSEYNQFEGRAYIISDKSDGVWMSPKEMLLRDQSNIKRDNDGNIIEPISNPIKSTDKDVLYTANIIDISTNDIGGVNIKCNPDGSGLLTAETTVDTGFYNEVTGKYDKKLIMNNPYYIEKRAGQEVGKIYAGYKIKSIDSRVIKVKGPREDGLLQSWYPMIQFGHYSRIIDQYGTHVKICYSMPEYDTQHFSTKYLSPCVDVVGEKVKILNSHMVKVECHPIHIYELEKDMDTYEFNGKYYKVYKTPMKWKDAEAFCVAHFGHLAMPKTQEINDFIVNLALKYHLNGLWLGATDEESEGIWKWVDGTAMTFSNWNAGEPNNSGGEHYLETYTQSNGGKWNDLGASSIIDGFIYECLKVPTVHLYKKIEDQAFEINIKDISFHDGVIITEDSISENDEIICDYTYVEENYIYRGYWRNPADFARIDLNPNMYHTYSDLGYTPSEIKSTKNLFNKVLYFFLRPSCTYEINADYDSLYYGGEFGRIKKTRTYTTEEPVYKDVVTARYTGDTLTANDASTLHSNFHVLNETEPFQSVPSQWGKDKDGNAITKFEWTWDEERNCLMAAGRCNVFAPLITNQEYDSFIHRVTFKSNVQHQDSNNTGFAVLVIAYKVVDGVEKSLCIGFSPKGEYGKPNAPSSMGPRYTNAAIGYLVADTVHTEITFPGKLSDTKNRGYFSFCTWTTANIGYYAKGIDYTGSTDGSRRTKTNYVQGHRNTRHWKAISDAYQGDDPNDSGGAALLVVRLPDSVKIWICYDYDGQHRYGNCNTIWPGGIPPEDEEPLINIKFSEYDELAWLSNTPAQTGYGVHDVKICDLRFENDIFLANAQETITTERVIDRYETVEHEEVYYEYGGIPEEKVKIISENNNTLYHQIDDPEPESDSDMYIGSVYIRQNTSLHSTVLVDSRVRGGGVLEAIRENFRHELEPESDYYLDIGYYDGEPYQENAVIIVRLDQRLLQEFGGKFTHGDIETKVKRWLGLGVFPIIEYVDAYAAKDMPQYTLEVENSYTNVIDITPSISVAST